MSSWDAMYEGRPPWDVGRPQPAFVRAEARGLVGASVLDAGCGSGEHALFFASRGHEAWGVDVAPRAIAVARRKAAERGVSASFVVGDAVDLARLGRSFDTVADSGLFHSLGDDAVARYVESVASVLAAGGRLLLLAFSDREPQGWGPPRRVGERDLAVAFEHGWSVEAVERTRFETNLGHAPDAVFAVMRRLG